MDIGKIPPNDIEAEQAVLGSMLTDKDAVISAIEVLKPEDFYREDNKIIYTAILSLYNRAEPIDIITLKSELISMGKFDNIFIVSDIDHTFLADDRSVPQINIEALKYFKSEGGQFTFATGRSHHSLLQAFPNAKDLLNAPAILGKEGAGCACL